MSEIKYQMKPVEKKRLKSFFKKSIYDPIIDEFINSGHNLVEISIDDKRSSYAVAQLQRRIETRELDIAATSAGGFIYLEHVPKEEDQPL